jgi:hypothetical protein
LFSSTQERTAGELSDARRLLETRELQLQKSALQLSGLHEQSLDSERLITELRARAQQQDAQISRAAADLQDRDARIQGVSD